MVVSWYWGFLQSAQAVDKPKAPLPTIKMDEGISEGLEDVMTNDMETRQPKSKLYNATKDDRETCRSIKVRKCRLLVRRCRWQGGDRLGTVQSLVGMQGAWTRPERSGHAKSCWQAISTTSPTQLNSDNA
jgi:hypothetical protein